MKENSMARLGGSCSILVGITYIVIGITYLLLPVEQQAIGAGSEFLTSVAEGATVLVIQYWAFAVGALLAIAAVMAISDLVRSANVGLVRWTSTLAIIGFAVVAVQYLIVQDDTPIIASWYVQVDSSAQTAIAAVGPINLDPDALMGFGIVGLWVLIVNWLALGGGQLPRILTYVGLAVGIAYWLVVAGSVLEIPIVVTIAAGLGGIILGPIWYIWTGIILRQTSKEAG